MMATRRRSGGGDSVEPVTSWWFPRDAAGIIGQATVTVTPRRCPVLSTRELFAKHNLRCTRQRTLVYEALRETDRHPTAEELHRLVSRGDERLSLATVYNTLEALEAAGLLRRLATEDGKARFDADTHPHAHVHLADTGEIVDVPHELGDALLERLPRDVIGRLEQSLGVRIESVSLLLGGRRSSAAAPPDAPA